jgi:hypothetical protein
LETKSTAPSASACSGGVGAALGQRGHHHHRQRVQAHQVFQEGQPVHARHFHVQGDHVRGQALDLLARQQRVGGGADHVDGRIAGQDLGEHLAHDGGVVDDQDPAGGVAGQGSFEQLHATGDRGLGQARTHGRFGGGHFGFVGMRQALHHHAAGIGEEPDLARMDAAQVLGDDRDVLGLQVLAHELGVAVPTGLLVKPLSTLAPPNTLASMRLRWAPA